MSGAVFNLFVYGTLRKGGSGAAVLSGCEHLGAASVPGLLYDIEGRFPALLLYGDAPVPGELWRCPASLLLRLDEYEGVDNGLFRRVGVEPVTPSGDSLAAWTYVAGPALSRKLTPDARLDPAVWPPPEHPAAP